MTYHWLRILEHRRDCVVVLIWSRLCVVRFEVVS